MKYNKTKDFKNRKLVRQMCKIRNLRIQAGEKQEQLAELLGISKPNYSKKESGSVRFSLDEAMRLSKHYQKPVEELFDVKESLAGAVVKTEKG